MTNNPRLLIGLDLGTSAVKGVVVGVNGDTVAQDKAPTPLEYQSNGRIEFDHDAFRQTVDELIKRLMAKAPADREVLAISFACASGNALLADEDGRPLTPAISWMDTRGTTEEISALANLDQDGVHDIVGWPFRGMFPLAQIGWMKDHLGDLCVNAPKCCMNVSCLVKHWTGRWLLDHSNATTFYLRNQGQGTWHQPYLDMLGLNPKQLPGLQPSGSIAGPLTPEAARATGLSTNTVVVLGAFDHPCAARATGVLEPGQALLSCGTSWVGFFPVLDRDAIIKQNMLRDPFLSDQGGPWGAMRSIPKIGTIIDAWIDEAIAEPETDDKYALFNDLADSAPPGSGGLVIDASIPLDEQRENVESVIRNHPKAAIARAVMEGVAFLFRDQLDSLAEGGVKTTQAHMVGGPAESPVWTQIVADVTGMTITLANGQSAGALGAAILAGIGAGVFQNEREGFETFSQDVATLNPNPHRQSTYDNLFQTFKKRQG